MTSLNLGPSTVAGTFDYYRDGSNRPVVRYVYPQDLNGDGVDEILFAGFETQPNTPSQYSNTSVHIFGWVNGKLKEVTSQWLPQRSGFVEGVGDVGFGDFNGDGRTDVFLSAYTDMDHPVNAYALINKGGYFEKVALGKALWQHGIAVADINRDGYSDVFASGYSDPVIYIGGANGLTPKVFEGPGSGSGIALADFLGNGTISAITVDSWIDGVTDFGLFTIDQNFNVSLFTALPQSRLGNQGHDVRVKAFDFSGDGLVDAMVFTRHGNSGSGWPEKSEIQFLLNKGNGIFSDVTDQVRVGYKVDTNVSYNPIFRDFNGDGLVDIFTSEASWSPTHDSTAILLQNKSGQFVDFARTKLSALIDPGGGISNIAMGPNGEYFLVGEKYATSSAGLLTTVYSVPLFFNQEPTLSKPISDRVATEGTAFSFTIPNDTFANPGDILKYKATLANGKALPKWLKFDATSLSFGGTPADADSGTTLQIKVTATDSSKLSASDTFDLVIAGVNVAPTAKSLAAVTATEGKAFSYALPKGSFSDADKGDTLTYSSSDLPTWLTINASTGKLTGTPGYTAADSTPQTVHLTATDSGNLSVSTALTINIKNVATIKGTAAANNLIAGNGTDTLYGLGGNDTLTGGAGTDKFVFDTAPNAPTNLDTITDFASGDILQLSSNIFRKLKGDKDLSDNLWTVGDGTQGAKDYLVFDPIVHTLSYDADGLGAAATPVAVCTLLGVSSLNYTDLQVI